MKRIVVCLLALVLAACTTQGGRVEAKDLQAIKQQSSNEKCPGDAPAVAKSSSARTPKEVLYNLYNTKKTSPQESSNCQ